MSKYNFLLHKKGVNLRDLIDLLKDREYTISELEKILFISKKVLLSYLEKTQKICKRKGWKFEIKPAKCKKCGFTFEKKISIPSKCPKCKSEWIEEPRFKIKNK